MRTTTLLALVATGCMTALTSAGCGDASGTSSSDYHTANYNDTTSTDPTAGAANETPPATDPTAAPAAPTTPAQPAQGGSFKVTVDSLTPTADMGATAGAVTVTVTPGAGFKGTVALSVPGLPAGVTAKFDNPSLDITGTDPVSAKLTFVNDLTAQATTLPLNVTATSGSLTSTQPINYKVNGQFTLSIPLNITSMEAAGGGLTDAWGKAFGVTPVALPPAKDGTPLSVKVINLDSAAHICHGNGPGNKVGTSTSTGNFPHGNTNAPLPQGGVDPATRTVTAGNTYNGYVHDLGGGSGTGFAIVIAAQ